MAEAENKSKFPLFWIMILVGIFMLFLLSYLFNHSKGFGTVLTWFFIYIFLFGILGLIIFAIIWLLKVHRIDMIHIFRERIIQAAKLNRPKVDQQLYMMGDHVLERRFIGHVEGICQIFTEPLKVLVDDKESDVEQKKIQSTGLINRITLITFRVSKGLLARLFSSTEIVACIDGDFTDLNGDIVYLRGMSFAPPLFGLLWLSKHYHDTNLIDETAKENINRYVMQELLKETMNIVNDGMAIHPQYQKEREKSLLQDLKKKEIRSE